MKRKLTKQEKELCERGIKIRKENLKNYETKLQYLGEFTAFNKKWAAHQEEEAKNAKEQKKKLIEETLNSLKEMINVEQFAINAMNKQLSEGVEIKKKPTGVG